MKIHKIIATITFILTLIPSVVFAQVYKCTTDGKVSYQSEACEEINLKSQIKKTIGFEFDGWKAGMTISKMKELARKKQLNMSPGTSTILSSYNETILNNQPEQRNYAYRTTFMGKLTGVVLYFTKSTKKLYRVKTTFYVIQLKQEERKYFYESLYSQLSEKYGKAKHVKNSSADKSISGALVNYVLSDILIPSLQVWSQDNENTVTLSYKKNYHTMTSYDLTYVNTPLAKENKQEVTDSLKQKTQESLIKDGSRL